MSDMLILTEGCVAVGSDRDAGRIFRLSGRQPLGALVLNTETESLRTTFESFLADTRGSDFVSVKACSDELAIHLEGTGTPFEEDAEIIVAGFGSREEFPSYARFRICEGGTSVEPLPGDSITYCNRGIFTSLSEPDVLKGFVAGIDGRMSDALARASADVLRASAENVIGHGANEELIGQTVAAGMVRRNTYDSYSTVHSLLRMSESERMEFARTAMRIVSLAEEGNPGNSRIAILSKDHGFVWVD